jgi:hypothetical protein
MDKQVLLRALQVEIQRHDLGTFMDEPQSGHGVGVPWLLAVPEAFEYEYWRNKSLPTWMCTSFWTTTARTRAPP